MSPLRLLAFESRRAAEMAELIRKRGGEPILAPAIREVPIADNPDLRAYLAALEGGQIDVVILLTGVGLRTLVDAIEPVCSRQRFRELLERTRLVARGPKPVAALREIDLVPQVVVPEPNTWRELLAAVDASLAVRGKLVAVQEYGVSNPELIAGLETRGARVLRVPIYRWALPDDLGPLRHGIDLLKRAAVDAALFTSASQVHHLFEVAGPDADAVVAGSRKLLIASIGPVCSEALAMHGLEVGFEPSHPKMGRLVGELIDRLRGSTAE